MLRFFTGKMTNYLFPSNLPIGTLVANLGSCIILGIALGVFKERITSATSAHLFLVTGLCGGYSTFSSFSLESLKLFQEGMILYAVLNIILSVVLCLLILWMFLK